jgi:hypothetical protein
MPQPNENSAEDKELSLPGINGRVSMFIAADKALAATFQIQEQQIKAWENKRSQQLAEEKMPDMIKNDQQLHEENAQLARQIIACHNSNDSLRAEMNAKHLAYFELQANTSQLEMHIDSLKAENRQIVKKQGRVEQSILKLNENIAILLLEMKPHLQESEQLKVDSLHTLSQNKLLCEQHDKLKAESTSKQAQEQAQAHMLNQFIKEQLIPLQQSLQQNKNQQQEQMDKKTILIKKRAELLEGYQRKQERYIQLTALVQSQQQMKSAGETRVNQSILRQQSQWVVRKTEKRDKSQTQLASKIASVKQIQDKLAHDREQQTRLEKLNAIVARGRYVYLFLLGLGLLKAASNLFEFTDNKKDLYHIWADCVPCFIVLVIAIRINFSTVEWASKDIDDLKEEGKALPMKR